VKDSLHPVWEETFTFSVPSDQLAEKRMELVVLDRQGPFVRSAAFNKAVIQLCEFGDFTQDVLTTWIPLFAIEKSSDNSNSG